jgi:hypothetical protein
MRVNSAAPRPTFGQSEHLFIPRKEWRRLLSPPNLSPYARVLVAGTQPAPLANWLAGLSFDVLAATDDGVALLQGRRSFPRVEFARLSADRCFLPGHAFDAAFVQPLFAHGSNWLSSSARMFTAGLLAAIKPNGRLICWRSASATDGHDDVCWLRHLACFPGGLEAHDVFDAPFPRLRRNARRTIIATWQSPSEWLSLDDWRNYARNGLLTDIRGCCNSAGAVDTSHTRRAA